MNEDSFSRTLTKKNSFEIHKKNIIFENLKILMTMHEFKKIQKSETTLEYKVILSYVKKFQLEKTIKK